MYELRSTLSKIELTSIIWASRLECHIAEDFLLISGPGVTAFQVLQHVNWL